MSRNAKPASSASAKSAKKTPLPAGGRREDIIQKAMSYFAEHGFAGGTRELAKEIGVAQPLLYKYFASKGDLIEAVFEVLEERARAARWHVLFENRSKPIEDRLIDFFTQYSERTYSYEWIRLYLFAGLSDGSMNVWHIQKVGNPLMARLCVEVAAEAGLTRAVGEVTQDELDIMWLLHGGLFYFHVRKCVYGEFVGRSFGYPIREGVAQALQSLRRYYADPPAPRAKVRERSEASNHIGRASDAP